MRRIQKFPFFLLNKGKTKFQLLYVDMYTHTHTHFINQIITSIATTVGHPELHGIACSIKEEINVVSS